MVIDKLDVTHLSDTDRQLVNKFEASQSNKVLKDMVSQRLDNYDAGEYTVEDIKKMNET